MSISFILCERLHFCAAMESFTIVIEYKSVKYGLVILPSFTIRQVKQAIYVMVIQWTNK